MLSRAVVSADRALANEILFAARDESDVPAGFTAREQIAHLAAHQGFTADQRDRLSQPGAPRAARWRGAAVEDRAANSAGKVHPRE